ncbi:latrophilin-3 [Biomphalaria glabrata]
MRCKGNELITYRLNKCWDLECIQCHCERPACEHYRICCPDISVPFDRRGVVMDDSLTITTVNHVQETEAKNRSTAPVLGCEYHPGLDHRFLFIRSCQPGYDVNQTVIDLCEMDRQPQEQTIETFIKVVDLERQTVYKNKFCAQCNHVTNTISSWNSAHFCPADYLKLEFCPLLYCRLSQLGTLPTLSCRLSQLGTLPTSVLQTISSWNSDHFCPADYLNLELCPLLSCRLSKDGTLTSSVLQTISSWNSDHFCPADYLKLEL